MRIVETYSHLNGLEFLLVHKKRLWSEIKRVVNDLDAEGCKTKVSEESRTAGTLFYSPKDINACFRESLNDLGWHESRVKYWVTKDVRLIRQTLTLSPEEQKKEIVAAGSEPLFSFNQTDFVKDRIAVEVQFGKYPFVAYDLFVKHLAFYVGDKIDVGIEILPMKSMSKEMSSGVCSYEYELYNVVRQGRGVPAVPLILVGVAP